MQQAAGQSPVYGQPGAGYGGGGANPIQQFQAVQAEQQSCSQKRQAVTGDPYPAGTTYYGPYGYYTNFNDCFAASGLTSNNTAQQYCAQARSDYTKAVSDFGVACSKAQLSMSGPSGSIQCSQAILECEGCDDGSSTSGKVDCSAVDDAEDAADDSTTTTDAITGQTSKVVQIEANKAQLTAEFTKCPALAGQDLKSKISEMQDQETKVQALQDKVEAAQQALSDMDAKFQADNDKNQNDQAQAGLTATSKLQDISTNLTKEQQQVASQILALQTDAQEAENSGDPSKPGISEINVAEASAAEKLNEYYTQALITCHNQSLAQVDQLRQQKLSEMSSSTYSAGGLNNLLKSVGLDSRTQAQMLTLQKDQYCQQDANFINGWRVAQQQEKITIQGLEAQKSALQKRINSDNTQIATLNSTTLKQDNSQASQQIQQVEAAYQAEMKNLQNQQKLAQTQYIQNRQLKAQELARLQQQLAEQQDYYQQKQDYVATANKFANGKQTDATAVTDAMEKFGDTKSKLLQVVQLCCQGPSPSADCPGLNASVCTLNGDTQSTCTPPGASPLTGSGGNSGVTFSGGGGSGGRRPAGQGSSATSP